MTLRRGARGRGPLRMDPEMSRELGYHGPKVRDYSRAAMKKAVDETVREAEVDAAVREGFRRYYREVTARELPVKYLAECWLGRHLADRLVECMVDAWREAHS